ncbi:MAG: hypothetical protein WCJ54_00235 [Actinomycetota bacterium]
MKNSTSETECIIFQKQQNIIKEITGKINKASVFQEKLAYARELKEEAEVLLSCQEQSEKISDCEKCHLVAGLQNKTAGLILKAEKLV